MNWFQTLFRGNGSAVAAKDAPQAQDALLKIVQPQARDRQDNRAAATQSMRQHRLQPSSTACHRTQRRHTS